MSRQPSEYTSFLYFKHRYGAQFQFKSFDHFYRSLGQRPKGKFLRRQDPSQPFSPENCFWGTRDVSAANKVKRTHGMSGSPTYESYASAKKRTSNPKCDCFDRYGQLGIRMMFRSFSEFFAEVGVRPAGMSLDRSNPFGNYQKGNVAYRGARWQKMNQRNSPLNLLYACIHAVLLDEGMSAEQAARECTPIAAIEKGKALAVGGC